MKKYIVPKKKVKECDGCCAVGMGDAVPCASGDCWDNVLGSGYRKRNKNIVKESELRDGKVTIDLTK